MKCMILEDEYPALKQMQSYIERTPSLTLVASVSNASDANDVYEKFQPDLIFVDINMPGLSGMDFVKSLSNPPHIIFTTAYSEYAIESYKVNAVDYLLKPIGYSDFLRAVEKSLKLHELEQSHPETAGGNEEYLFVRSEHRLVRIRFAEIEYVEGMREYIRIHLEDKSSVMTLFSMKSLGDRLPKDRFMRVHRSFIVNLDKITIVKSQHILFGKDVMIPIGEQYKEAFSEYINKTLFG